VGAQDPEALELIEEHIARHIGKPSLVFHEMPSQVVHVDVHLVNPTPERDYYTLVTAGMSDRPMKAPPQAPYRQFSELLLCLPSSWPLEVAPGQTDQSPRFWPVHTLRSLARFPHLYNTWLWEGHTVANGDPPEPFDPDTRLCCALLARPTLFDEALRTLQINERKTVHFHSVIPIYREESDLRLKRGTEELLRRLAANGVSELLDVHRKNVARRGFMGLLH
jgi:hypothetical protein